MKSIKLNVANRAEIKKALMLVFARNYFKDTAFENIADVHIAVNKAFRKGIRSAWFKAYGAWSFHIDHVPKAILSTGAFSVTVECEPSLTKALTDPAFPGNARGVDLIISLEEHNIMFADYIELDSIAFKYFKELSTFEKEVTQVLDSVTTSRQLLGVWPSIEGYIPEHLYNPDKRFNLPAIRVEDLDAKLS